MRTDLKPVIRAADALFDEMVEQIRKYVAYAPVSAGGMRGAAAPNVRKLVRAIIADLESLPTVMRPTRARIHELPDALPAVFAEWDAGDDRPSLLVYGHGDTQPADPDEWDTPPFDAIVKDGRLYGRGTSDDMGGWLSHVAAVRAWLSVEETLPIGVRLLVETEEEIGSPSLPRYLAALPLSDVDAVVLTDCENPTADTPGLTVSLRGLATADLICRAEDGGHSGLFGSIWPDPSLALIELIHRLLTNGRPNFSQVQVPGRDRERLAKATGVVSRLPDDGRPAAEWAWRQPAITILGTSLPDVRHGAATTNSIRQQVAARLSIRVPPGLTPNAVLDEVRRIVTASPPPGIEVRLEAVAGEGATVDPWLYDLPDCIAVDAVDRAYERVWGKRPERIGVGGSIPFVKLFAERFADKPLFLNGVLDPISRLHMPNESLDLDLFRRAIHTNVHLLAELGALPKGGFLAAARK